MTTPDLTLLHFPGACSSVSVCALEMAELPYQLRLVNIAVGEQGTPEHQAVSPMGKVPALLVDGEPLLENGAIITLVHALRPDAGVFPMDESPRGRAEAVGGLLFCSGTLHPQIRGMLNPQRITTGDGEPVRERSRELAAKSFGYAEARMAERGWWLSEMSIVDVYLEWAFGVGLRAGLEADRYPALAQLANRLQPLPAYGRMQEVDRRAREELGL